MPALFVGHGSPMNAIEDNVWSRGFRGLATALPPPKAILAISAHWYVEGTFTTVNERPETILRAHDSPEQFCLLEHWHKGLWITPGKPRGLFGRLLQRVRGTSSG